MCDLILLLTKLVNKTFIASSVLSVQRAACMRSVHVQRAACTRLPHAACRVPRAACSVQRAACSVQRAACSVQRAACSVQRAACSVQRAACSVQRAACSVQRAACSVRRPIYSELRTSAYSFRYHELAVHTIHIDTVPQLLTPVIRHVHTRNTKPTTSDRVSRCSLVVTAPGRKNDLMREHCNISQLIRPDLFPIMAGVPTPALLCSATSHQFLNVNTQTLRPASLLLGADDNECCDVVSDITVRILLKTDPTYLCADTVF